MTRGTLPAEEEAVEEDEALKRRLSRRMALASVSMAAISGEPVGLALKVSVRRVLCPKEQKTY
jgi:hypothetical protein